VALRIGFRHLTHFLLISTGVVATLVEADWWLSPPPWIAHALPPVCGFFSLAGRLRVWV
jgi:hypothetical protein